MLRSYHNLPPIPWFFQVYLKLKHLEKTVQSLEDAVLELTYTISQNITSKWRMILSMQKYVDMLENRLWFLSTWNESLQRENFLLKEHFHKNKRCECCFEENEELKSCDSGHKICTDCIQSWCNVVLNKKNKVPDRVRCCAQGECFGFIPWETICTTDSGMRLLKEKHTQEFVPIVADLLRASDADTFIMKLPFIKSDGKSYAAKCPNCGFGPLLHDRCDDLTTHHNSGEADNRCPQCLTLTVDANDLLPWEE